MSAKAGSVTVTTVGEYIYADADGCTTVLVRVHEDSTNPALVNVEGLHGADFFPIPIGGEVLFRLFNLGIKRVFAKGDGGDSDIEFGAVAKT